VEYFDITDKKPMYLGYHRLPSNNAHNVDMNLA